MKIKLAVVLFILSVCRPILAQEQLGLKISNYSGINSTVLNPAWSVGGPLNWDVSIIAAGLFVEQDYTFGQQGSLLQIFKNGATFITEEESTDGNLNSIEEVPFYFNAKNNFDIHLNAFAMAPSFMANIKGHTIGFYMQGRTWLSGYNIDGALGYANLNDSLIFIGQIDPFQIGAMAWGEVGFNYGRQLPINSRLDINIGGTVKFLLGYEAADIQNQNQVNLNRADDAINIDPANIDIAYATNYTDGGYDFQRNGFGIATDIGITIVDPNPRNDKQHHQWKLGISLLDVGKIWYSKNTNDYAFNSSDTSSFSTEEFENIEDADDVIEAINNSGNTTSATLVDNKFSMWMPSALSVQFDAPIIGKLYVSGTAVIGMRFKSEAIERSDLLAITPRFESKWFEWGIPVSVYRWNDFNVGSYFRMGPLTIGTESINSWIVPSTFEGSDIYLALKVNSAMFKKRSKNKSNGKGMGCYSNDF